MARPRKLKKIYNLPRFSSFAPLDAPENTAETAEHDGVEAATPMVMSVEEYETIRLIDVEGMTQEQCAAEMEIARTTVQGLYAGARQKLGDFLVYGRKLRIGGGEYRVDHSGTVPGGHGRRRIRECALPDAPAGHGMGYGRGQGRGSGRGSFGHGRMAECAVHDEDVNGD